jgi:hypothetical protein
VDTTKSHQHCGSCTHACSPGTQCQGGTCM